jgi:hypothetical protein
MTTILFPNRIIGSNEYHTARGLSPTKLVMHCNSFDFEFVANGVVDDYPALMVYWNIGKQGSGCKLVPTQSKQTEFVDRLTASLAKMHLR